MTDESRHERLVSINREGTAMRSTKIIAKGNLSGLYRVRQTRQKESKSKAQSPMSKVKSVLLTLDIGLWALDLFCYDSIRAIV
jgi:hypothetical protein